MEISNNSNVNFNGRLNVAAMNKDASYWKNVARLISEKTTDCPKDIFKLSEDADGIALDTSRKGSDITHSLFWDNASDLLRHSEEVISDKFAKLMRAFKNQDELYGATNDYLKGIKSLMTEDEFCKFEETAWENAVNVGFKTNKIIENDEILGKAFWDD